MIDSLRMYLRDDVLNPRAMEFHIVGELEKNFESTESVYEIRNEVVRMVADKVSDYIIQNNMSEILANIDIKAISNMAIAESGVKINETLNKKLPDKILEIEKISERTNTEIYQRGLFGCMQRIR